MLHQKTAVCLFMVAVAEMKTTLNQRRTVKPNAWLKILPAQRLLEFRSLEIFSYLMENPCMMDTHQTAMRMATLSQSSVNITWRNVGVWIAREIRLRRMVKTKQRVVPVSWIVVQGRITFCCFHWFTDFIYILVPTDCILQIGHMVFKVETLFLIFGYRVTQWGCILDGFGRSLVNKRYNFIYSIFV